MTHIEPINKLPASPKNILALGRLKIKNPSSDPTKHILMGSGAIMHEAVNMAMAIDVQ